MKFDVNDLVRYKDFTHYGIVVEEELCWDTGLYLILWCDGTLEYEKIDWLEKINVEEE